MASASAAAAAARILRRSNHTPTNQTSEMFTAGAGAGALSRRSRQHTLQPGPGLHPSPDCTAPLLNNNNKPQIQPGPQSAMLEVYYTILGRSLSDDLPGLEQTQHMVVEVYKKQPQCPRRPPAFGCCGRWKSMAFRPSNGFGLHTRGYHIWTNMEQGPPPTNQLSFCNQYDFMLAGWVHPQLYFEIHNMVYKMDKKRLLHQEDWRYYLPTDPAKKFLKPLLTLAGHNNQRGYSIAPSLTLDNLRVSLVSGTCVFIEPRFCYIGEMVGTERIDRATSYFAVREIFEELIRTTETDDVLTNMCPSFNHMFSLIEHLRTVPAEKALLYEKVIIDHPCMMSSQGSVILMRDADMILRRQYKYAPKTSKIRRLIKSILISLPYLGPNDDQESSIDEMAVFPNHQELWTDIAKNHPLLRCWHQFKQQQRQQHELARQEKGENDSASSIQNNGAEQEKKLDREQIGSGLVGLCRDGVNHLYDPHVKKMLKKLNDGRKFKIFWPLKIEEVIDVMEINLPGYKPKLVEGLLSYLDWAFSRRRYCWPRDDRCDSLIFPVPISKGTQAKLLKLGREDIIIKFLIKYDEMHHAGGFKVPEGIPAKLLKLGCTTREVSKYLKKAFQPSF
uniref:Uncharacterized protein n=1 Tax=Oryza punctata TaxID=4537 RepID=A0A0E0MC17_ORYPU